MGINRTPYFGIATPDGGEALRSLPAALAEMAQTTEDALRAAGVMPNTPRWIPYTPVITGLTLGNGTVRAGYTRAGNLIHWRARIICGSTTVVDQDLRISLPVAADNTVFMDYSMPMGVCQYVDETGGSNAGRFMGVVIAFSPTMALLRQTAAGSNLIETVRSNSPFTWATNDAIALSITYAAGS